MLAYAPERRALGAAHPSRRTLALVVVGHVALVAVALTTKMVVERAAPPPIIETYPVPPDPTPPPPEPAAEPTTPVTTSRITPIKPVIPIDIPLDTRVTTETGPTTPLDPVGPIGPVEVKPVDPPHIPVKIGVTLRTPESLLRPPYPNDKLRMEEEATLRLRLTIDANGRVTSVEPVGKADPSFLESARRHLIRNWRYKPATVDGVATPTTITINLSFRLENA